MQFRVARASMALKNSICARLQCSINPTACFNFSCRLYSVISQRARSAMCTVLKIPQHA